MTALHVLPQRIRAEYAVSRGQHIEGRLGLEQLPRLRTCVAGGVANIEASLRGVRDDDRSQHVRGNIQGRLPLVCERCGEPFEWPFAIEVDWRLVGSESEEQRLLAECEPVLIKDDWLPVRALVEDEVMLVLPMLPRCGCGTAS